jgi:hypothetical protein
MAVPPELPGLRTIFNAFHHFRPREARAILASAVKAARPIAVFELVGREWPMILSIPFVALASLFVMPTVRPLRWSWLFFTYVVPVIPLLIAFDGVVSCLRVYSVAELEGLTEGIPRGDGRYRFEAGRVRIGKLPVHATYLIGMPTEAHGG